MALVPVLKNIMFDEGFGLEECYHLTTTDIGSPEQKEWVLRIKNLDVIDIKVLEAADAAIGPFPKATPSEINDPSTFKNQYTGLTLFETFRGKMVYLGATPEPSVLNIWNNSVYWNGTDWVRRIDGGPAV